MSELLRADYVRGNSECGMHGRVDNRDSFLKADQTNRHTRTGNSNFTGTTKIWTDSSIAELVCS